MDFGDADLDAEQQQEFFQSAIVKKVQLFDCSVN